MLAGRYKHTKEHTQKLMVALKPYCFPKGHSPWNKGLFATTDPRVAAACDKGLAKYARSPEGRQKSREMLGKRSKHFWENVSDEERQAFICRRALRIKETRPLPEAVEKQRASMLRTHGAHPEWGLKVSQVMKTKHRDPRYRQETVARLHQGRDASWADPDCKARRIQRMLQASWRRPTYIEQKVIDAIEEYNLPYRYVGDGAFILDGKNPDFMNTNGQKKLLEVFGEYWHDRNSSEAEDRQNAFAKYGFHTLILWETDLKHMDSQAIAQVIEVFGLA